MAFDPALYRQWSAGTDFGDGGYGDDFGHYGSIRFADVNHDGYLDVCGRNAKGIECGMNGKAGAFKAATAWLTTEFTDANGWNDEAYGGTLQYADIDGDGWVDVCGRATDGIRCATSDKSGKGFYRPHLWGASDDFDDAGWGLARNNYFSIHLADVNGDGRADVCGRGSAGLVCGFSMGEAFSKSTPMMTVSPAFADADGWDSDPYGSTLAFANLNGDSHLDVCGHGPLAGVSGSGLRCAYAP